MSGPGSAGSSDGLMARPHSCTISMLRGSGERHAAPTSSGASSLRSRAPSSSRTGTRTACRARPLPCSARSGRRSRSGASCPRGSSSAACAHSSAMMTCGRSTCSSHTVFSGRRQARVRHDVNRRRAALEGHDRVHALDRVLVVDAVEHDLRHLEVLAVVRVVAHQLRREAGRHREHDVSILRLTPAP
jgi:hypothetical protein